MNTFNHHTGKEWKIRPRPKLSWLLFRWGKDVYDNEDQKIMSFEHSFLSKITHKYTWFHSLTVFILYTFTFLWLLLNNIIYFPASSIWQQLLIGPIFFLLFFFLLSPFLPLFFRQRKYVIKDRNRKLAGNISCNWGNSLWTVTDHLKKSVATVNFTTREIITHSGSFTISPSTKHGEFFKVIVKNTVDPSGFTIVRKEKISRLSLSGYNVPDCFTISISSNENNNLFLFLTASFCIVEKMLDYHLSGEDIRRYKKYGGWKR